MVSRNRKSIVDKWNTFESYDSNQEIHYERSFSFMCDLGLKTWSLNGGGSSERLDNEIPIAIQEISLNRNSGRVEQACNSLWLYLYMTAAWWPSRVSTNRGTFECTWPSWGFSSGFFMEIKMIRSTSTTLPSSDVTNFQFQPTSHFPTDILTMNVTWK